MAADRLTRDAPGRYRCGAWTIIQASRSRWEVWEGDGYRHAFRTLAEARAFVRNEIE